MERQGTTSSSPSGDGPVDPTPLLTNSAAGEGGSRQISRRPSLRGAARLLQRATGRRMTREPSMRVREAAAEQLEERQSAWAYSRPVVVLDIIWNLAFVFVGFLILALSKDESPQVPLEIWIVGYALQCVLHILCVCMEYRRRWESRRVGLVEEDGNQSGGSLGTQAQQEADQVGEYGAEQPQVALRVSVAKHLEFANTMFSFIWWIIGFYWISAGGQNLTREAPLLYWLCIVFLAFDVFFVVFCVALACVIGIAVCCCLPCIIAILYAVADQEGATEEDICQLPKLKFRRGGNIEKLNGGEVSRPFGGIMTEYDGETPIQHLLSTEDAECCICISAYDDGVELRKLPCGHHFHCTCIDKWLLINATCPLCKFNILKRPTNGREEV